MKKILFLMSLIATVFAASAFAAGRVKTVIDECDLSKSYSPYSMDSLIEQGYKLIAVIQLDNPPQSQPGYSPRKCSYVFAQQ